MSYRDEVLLPGWNSKENRDKKSLAIDLGLTLLQRNCKPRQALGSGEQAIWVTAAGQVLHNDPNFSCTRQALDRTFQLTLRKIRNRTSPRQLAEIRKLLEQVKGLQGGDIEHGIDVSPTKMLSVNAACDRFFLKRGMEVNEWGFNKRIGVASDCQSEATPKDMNKDLGLTEAAMRNTLNGQKELLPCPFCGVISVIYMGFCVQCNNCNAQGPSAASDEEARELWQTRGNKWK